MTLPNLITIARIGMVPWVLVALLRGQNGLAFVLFAIAGASDALDGILARFMNQRSELGAFLDPIADKIMLVGAFVVLGWLGEFPVWFVVLVVGRDIGLVLGGSILHLSGRPIFIPPLPVSKVTTLLQIALVAYVMATLAFPFGHVTFGTTLMWLSAAFTAMSALAYTLAAMRWLGDGLGQTETGQREA